MKTLLFAAVVSLGTASFAFAQSGIATAPSNNSTGPTVPDTRQVDQNPLNTTGNATNSTSDNPPGWRASSGLNADPNNPNGAPGPSTGIGTSPTR